MASGKIIRFMGNLLGVVGFEFRIAAQGTPSGVFRRVGILLKAESGFVARLMDSVALKREAAAPVAEKIRAFELMIDDALAIASQLRTAHPEQIFRELV